jgi:hypothetical protein
VAIAAGYHNGSGGVVGDTDLVAANIKNGVTLFGVTGTALEASGSASPSQVLTGTSFSNSSGAATGTMPAHGAVVLTPTTTSVAIAAGYHNGSGGVVGDTDLVAANIKNGVTLFGVTGTLSTGVPKTGQATSSTVGDDGDLEKGVALPTPRFTDNGNGTVTDNLTGLIWLKNVICGGTRTWANALAFANSLHDGWTGDSSGGDCGLSDGSTAGQWRLPNVREMHSLIHYGYADPAMSNTAGTGKWTNGDPFTNVGLGGYWTSTYNPKNSSDAWYVELRQGDILGLYRTSSAPFFWPVRGGQ